MSIPVKTAVSAAIAFVNDLFGDKARDVSLEEVELSEDDHYWLVTIGFIRHDTEVINAIRALAGGSPRLYKVIKVDAATGEAASMKIREVTMAL